VPLALEAPSTNGHTVLVARLSQQPRQ